MTFWIIVAFVGLLVISTLIPLLPIKKWWVRDFDFPRLQLSFIAVFMIIAEIVFLDFSETSSWVLCSLTILCLSYQTWWIIPYTPFFHKEVKTAVDPDASERLKIIVANVFTPNRRTDIVLAMAKKHDPDVLVLVETDRWWEAQLAELKQTHPHTLKCPLDNLYGMHLYSKLPLKDAEIQFLVEKDVPSMHALLLLPSGVQVRLHCVHPAPPSPTENETSLERDAELVMVAKNVSEATLPVIVTGDLNDVAWSSTTRLFRKISGLLDPRVGRGMFNTFHAKYPVFRWPLDHFFHSTHFTLVSLERLDYIGSDHFPMFITLCFQPQKGKDQETLEADAEDEARAEEELARKGVSEEDVHEPGE